MLEGIKMKIDKAALNRHSFADLLAMRDFALNMHARLEQEELKTSFDLRASKHWKEVSSTLDFEMSERMGKVFTT